jgi:formylglycine-generating enzyme required for sulfatase activity
MCRPGWRCGQTAWLLLSLFAACYSSSGKEADADGDSVTGAEDGAGDLSDADSAEAADETPSDLAEVDTEDGGADGVEDGAADGTPAGMILVPNGPFLMGSDTSDCVADDPQHEVWLSAYYIDQFEVTNADYEGCVAAGACTAPPAGSLTRTAYYGAPEFGDYPVLAPHWEDASAYCAWAGKRLPTEAEWEKAARGGCEVIEPEGCESPTDARLYPWWGDAFPTCDTANVFRACVGDTARVRDFPNDVSAYGLRGMEGNVREWVADYYDATYYSRSPADNPTGPTWEEALGRCPLTGVHRCHVTRGHGFSSDASPFAVFDLTCRGYSEDPYTVGVRCAAPHTE